MAGTVGLSAGAAAWVAVAGGAGAFLGAVAGQIIQAVRDRNQRKTEDRRRSEDRDEREARERREHHRQAYVTLIGQAARLRDLLSTMRWTSEQIAGVAADGGDIESAVPMEREMFERAATQYDKITKEATDLCHAYGTAAIRDAFDVLAGCHACFDDPWFDPRGGRYIYATREEDRLRLHLTEVSEPRRDNKRLQLSRQRAHAVATWVMRQLRYELGIDATPPEPLPYRLALYMS